MKLGSLHTHLPFDIAAEGRQKVQCRADLHMLLFAFCRYSSYTYMILICIPITLRRSLLLFIYRDIIIIIGCHLLRRHEIHFWSFVLLQLYPSFNWLLLIFIAIACFSAPSHWSIILCSWLSDILRYEQLSS